MKGFLAVSALLLAFMVVHGDPLQGTRNVLVTMTKQELVEVYRCITKSRDPVIQRNFEQCENLLPPQVFATLKQCRLEVVPEGMRKCNYYSVLYDFPEFPPKLYNCVNENTELLSEAENKKMVDFENCAKNLYSKSCQVSGHLRQSSLKYL